MSPRLSAALLALAGLGCTDAAPPAPAEPPTPAPEQPDGPRTLRLAIQTNVHGDIEPCG